MAHQSAHWAACSQAMVRPPPNWLKMNVDASLLPSNRAGLGLVIRDHEGKLVLAVGHHIEHWDANFVELLVAQAMKDVIEDWMFDCTVIIIEGDCSKVIVWLQQLRDHRYKIHREIADVVLSFLGYFNQVLFNYVPRQSNRPADLCARYALDRSFIWKFVSDSDVPDAFTSLLREESNRV
ncbi:uncharacterized protein LOC110107442 [Dendrobium catenatum]|uniref:uncharacterized protein LOC110107442 n=1 Tax=Dendrobium catenatum TaxID=906689 RepID=UPI0009F64720|nr:uncharacterized protein LOC110107442 [Dendrobium catenatum]